MHVVVVAVSARTSPSGVCRHAANLALGMLTQASVDRVTMLVGSWQAEYLRTSFGLNGLKDERLKIVPVSIPNISMSRNLWYLSKLPAISGELQADIVHLSFPMPVLRPFFAVPVVVSLHDLYPFDIPENFGRRAWLNRAALRLCLRNADVVASVSATTQARLFELFPWLESEKAVVVPNAVALRSSATPVALPPEVEDTPFLLCVAQHRANKNLALLIDAFHLARRQENVGLTTKLVIAGHFGPETGRLQRRVKEHGLDEHVIFLRDLSDAQLYALYVACEMVVAPSLVEGFGLPVAEALAVGCRVVCSDLPVFRELAGDICLYFDPRDSSGKSLSGAIQQGLVAERPPASAFLTQEEVAKHYLDLYSRLLPSRKLKPYEGEPGSAPA